MIKRPMLIEKYVRTRFAWAKENKDRDWSKIFTDETSFWTHSIQRSWSTTTNKFVQRIVKHTIKHAWSNPNEKFHKFVYRLHKRLQKFIENS